MSIDLRLPTNQADQHRSYNRDKRDRDKTGGKNVPETMHHEKSDICRIHRNQKLGGDDHHILM